MKNLKKNLCLIFGSAVMITSCGQKIIEKNARLDQADSIQAEKKDCHSLNETGENCTSANFLVGKIPATSTTEAPLAISWESELKSVKYYTVAYSKAKDCTLLEMESKEITDKKYDLSFKQEGDFFLCVFAFNEKNEKYPALNSGTPIKVSKVPKALLAISSKQIDLGSHLINKEVSAKIKVKNVGSAAASNLNISGFNDNFYFTEEEFPGTNGTCTKDLDINEECILEIAFKSVDKKEASAELKINFNNGVKDGEELIFNMSAKSINPAKLEFVDGNEYSFGVVAASSSGEHEFELKNTGDYKASNVEFSAFNAPFSMISTDCEETLDPEKSCKIKVKYSPTVQSEIIFSWLVEYNDGLSQKSKDISIIGNPN